MWPWLLGQSGFAVGDAKLSAEPLRDVFDLISEVGEEGGVSGVGAGQGDDQRSLGRNFQWAGLPAGFAEVAGRAGGHPELGLFGLGVGGHGQAELSVWGVVMFP